MLLRRQISSAPVSPSKTLIVGRVALRLRRRASVSNSGGDGRLAEEGKSTRGALAVLYRFRREQPLFIASAANNLGEALELFARYSRIVNEAMRIKLVRAPEGVVAEITFGDHSRQSTKEVTEFATAVICLFALR
jgi:hypothetical protein